jgi:putative MATE family efflux protein
MGDTRTFRDVLIAGFFLNLILDPWLMFGGLGVPALGVRGLALATVIIQLLGCLFMLYRILKSKLWQTMNPRFFIPEPGAFRDIACQGFPASINMSTVAVGIFVITWFISRFSTEGVAAYGIATRIEQIALLPSIGLNMAVLSLVGQNHGAGLADRVRETWLTTLKYGLWMMAGCGVAIHGLAPGLMALFTGNPEVIRIGAEYLRVASITLCSYIILFQTVFLLQGLKRPMMAIWIGLYRQIVAPCLVFYLLAFQLDWQLNGIWWGIFLVTWSAAIFLLFHGRSVLRRMMARAGDPVDRGRQANVEA